MWLSLSPGLLLCLSPAILLAQAAPAPVPAAGAPSQLTLRATTRMVQLTVIVQDSKGRAITDLGKDDFVVTDDGAPQQIRFFSLDSGDKNAPPHVPLDPDAVSNQRQRGSFLPSRTTAILLDFLNTPRSDLNYARQQLVQFVQRMGPQDTVSVYALGQELKVVQDFTNDPPALLKALASHRGTAIENLTDNSDPNTLGYFVTDDPVLRTVKALESIASHLAGLPGRKSLVWVTAGLPAVLGLAEAEGVSAGSEVPGEAASSTRPLIGKPLSLIESHNEDFWRAIRAMNNADVAIYPVDARGLMATTAQSNSNIFTMQHLARRTGGKAFINGNDLHTAIRQAIDDSRVVYRLAFYPGQVRGDNSFHSVEVKVHRPGTTVRCRRGYFDFGEPEQDVESRKTAVRVVLASHLNATGLGVTARVFSVSKPQPARLQVDVNVDPADLRFEQQNQALVGNLDIVLVPMDERGQAYPGVFDPVRLNLDPDSYQRLLKSGIHYRRIMDYDRKAKILKIVARDTSTGAIGSVTVALSHLKEKPSNSPPGAP